MNKSNCPSFSEETYEKILDWAGDLASAKVEWSEVYVDNKGNRHRDLKMSHWSLTWKYGVIGFMSLRDCALHTARQARIASALFIHLWCRGVDVRLSSDLAELYANFSTFGKFEF
jgi:hypothetical protein